MRRVSPFNRNGRRDYHKHKVLPLNNLADIKNNMTVYAVFDLVAELTSHLSIFQLTTPYKEHSGGVCTTCRPVTVLIRPVSGRCVTPDSFNQLGVDSEPFRANPSTLAR